jgi:hypothetical protein
MAWPKRPIGTGFSSLGLGGPSTWLVENTPRDLCLGPAGSGPSPVSLGFWSARPRK